MKRKLLAAAAVVCAASFTVMSYAAQDDIKVSVNGTSVDFADQLPVIESGRTLVPMRAIFEALGADVQWDSASKTVTSTKDDTIVSIAVGKSNMTVNGESVVLDVPAAVINDRTMVPLRAVSEAFGAAVDWDAAAKSISIIESNETTTEITTEKTTEKITEEETETTTKQKISSGNKEETTEEEETTKKKARSYEDETEETTKRRRNSSSEDSSSKKSTGNGYGTIDGNTYKSDGETFEITLDSDGGWSINKAETKDNRVVLTKDDDTELEIVLKEDKTLDDLDDVPENEMDVEDIYADMDSRDIVFSSKKISGGKKVTYSVVTDVYARACTYVQTDYGVCYAMATLNNSEDADSLRTITESFTGID